MPSNSKFTINNNGDTSVRVSRSVQDVSDVSQDSIFCTDEDGNTAIRVITAQESLPASDPDSVFGKDTNGNTAMRVVGAGGGGGGDPVINSLSVTPSTSAQTITPETGVDGFSPVNVSAVDASIDENIVAGNIKDGVTILGVTGSVVELNGTTASVTPTTSAQTITPTAPINGFTEVSVGAVTSAIDANITAENIKSGVDILGITGTYTGSGPAYYIEKTVSNGSILTNESTSFIDLTGITEIGNSGLFRAYSNNTHITSFDMKNVTVLSGISAMESCFHGCSGITTANLSPVHTISGTNAFTSTFYGCTNLVTAYCDTIVAVTVNNGMYSSFSLCSNLKTASFNKLNVIQYPLAPSYGAVFNNCSKLEDVYLGGLTASTFANAQNQLQYLFNNNTGKDAPNGCTVHFPSNFDPSDPNHTFDASTLTGYPTFNGTASYIHVAFDLAASE